MNKLTSHFMKNTFNFTVLQFKANKKQIIHKNQAIKNYKQYTDVMQILTNTL